MKKLGIKPEMRLWTFEAPPYYAEILGPLPEGAHFVQEPGEQDCDFVHVFVKEKSLLLEILPLARQAIHHKGMVWISWPKKASKVPTDLDGGIIRETGLAGGLVDVKVCAVDEVWSGHKFVYRLKDRKA